MFAHILRHIIHSGTICVFTFGSFSLIFHSGICIVWLFLVLVMSICETVIFVISRIVLSFSIITKFFVFSICRLSGFYFCRFILLFCAVLRRISVFRFCGIINIVVSVMNISAFGFILSSFCCVLIFFFGSLFFFLLFSFGFAVVCRIMVFVTIICILVRVVF